MIEHFRLDSSSIVMKSIPKSVLIDQAKEKEIDPKDLNTLKSIELLASLQPSETMLELYKKTNKPYDEIQFVQIELFNMDYMFVVANALMKIIPYLLIVIIKHQDKYMLCLSKPNPHHNYTDRNVVRGFFHTYWIFQQDLTGLSGEILSALDLHQYAYSSLDELYIQQFNRLLNYKSNGISKTNFSKMISFFIGRGQPGEKKQLIELCTPYPVEQRDTTNPNLKYQKKVLTKYNYIYKFDYEDIWHAVMQNPELKECLAVKGLLNATAMIDYWRDFEFCEREYIDTLDRGKYGSRYFE